MRDIIKRILGFCNKKHTIFLYGSGIRAFVLYDFLSGHKVHIKGCLTTKENKFNNKFRNNIPIIPINNLSVNQIEECGIILALPECYHVEVKQRIKDSLGEVNVFELSDDDIETVRAFHWRRRRYERILSRKSDIAGNHLYDQRIEFIKTQYKYVSLNFIDLKVMGSYVSWIYNCWNNLGQDVYYLYYPVTIYASSVEDDELKGFNRYLISKLNIENISVLSWRNVDFWKYFYQTNENCFVINNECNLKVWNIKFNSYLYNLQKNADERLLNKKYIFFSDEERVYGEHQLNKISNKEIVCFLVRDNAYNKNRTKLVSDSQMMSSKYRNASIKNYQIAMEELYNSDLQSVRMGEIVEESIEWKNTVDYASKCRSEFMDVYLLSKSKFLVTTLCGITALANLFSKPLVITNSSLLSTRGDYSPITVRDRDLIIFKKFWWKKQGRYLSFREMLERETDSKVHPTVTITTFSLYERDGIVPIENTPEEINDVVQEMVERLNGTMVYTEDDDRLQKIFFDLIDTFPMKENFPIMCRVGTKFLRENQWLLD